MSIKEEYKIKNLELQERIEEELECVKQGKSKKNIGQLQYILNELKKN